MVQPVFKIRIKKSKKRDILSRMKTIEINPPREDEICEPCFTCPHCEKTFKQNGNLHTHMMRHHGTGKPSTRVDRNNVRKHFAVNHQRFITIEDTNSKKPKRFTIHDTLKNEDIVSGFDQKFSARNAGYIIDNLNIILGLINNQTHNDFVYHWSDFNDSIDSLKNDRPKQAAIIQTAFDVISNL